MQINKYRLRQLIKEALSEKDIINIMGSSSGQTLSQFKSRIRKAMLDNHPDRIHLTGVDISESDVNIRQLNAINSATRNLINSIVATGEPPKSRDEYKLKDNYSIVSDIKTMISSGLSWRDCNNVLRSVLVWYYDMDLRENQQNSVAFYILDTLEAMESSDARAKLAAWRAKKAEERKRRFG